VADHDASSAISYLPEGHHAEGGTDRRELVKLLWS